MKSSLKKLIPNSIIKEYHAYRKRQEIKSYLGEDVVCSICHSKFKQFAPFGLVTRENARCLHCGSLERHRLLWKYLHSNTNIFDGGSQKRLLHFAPEKMFYDVFSQNKNILYTPCDLFPEAYDHKGKVKVIRVDITNIPFEANHFDAIICSHVLEHIIDDRLAMSELYRVMKKGGWGIFQVPLDYSRTATYEDFSITTPEEREKAFGQIDHVRVYGQDYKNRLKQVGFEVKEDEYVKSFSEEELFKYGLMASELIYYCRK